MNCDKIIGAGNTATVYEWEAGRVLKLFCEGYSKEAAEKEFYNAMVIRDLNFSKPKAYKMITYKERIGIIYDKVEGESLLDWVLKTHDVDKCAVYMADLHKTIIKNTMNQLSSYKDFLRFHVTKVFVTDFSKREEVFRRIDKLPDGDKICHGDFHPGNIIMSNETVSVIDFMNLCRGNYLYDVARTVFLIEFTPVPVGIYNKENMVYLKKTLTERYLAQMNVTREMIQDYLSVIMIARKGECPEEQIKGKV